MARKLLSPLRSVGHSSLQSRKLSARQLQTLRKRGWIKIKIAGRTRIVRKRNVRKGYVYYYKRSDTGSVALRDFVRDYQRKARRRYIREKPFTGD